MPGPEHFNRTIEDSLVLALFDIASALEKLGEDVSARAGLTTQQWLMLLQIAGDPNFATPRGRSGRHEQGVMASEIAQARGVSRANVSTLVTQLLRMGLINQAEHAGDRRRKHLSITPAGLEALSLVEPARHEANRRLFADLTPKERRQLLRSLHSCLERLWRAEGPAEGRRRPAKTTYRRST